MVFAFSISVHESAHAYAAYLLGIRRLKSREELQLTIKAPWFVWDIDDVNQLYRMGKTCAYNPSNFKNKKAGTILVSLAGPLSNLILAVLFAVPFAYVTLKYYPLENNPLNPR